MNCMFLVYFISFRPWSWGKEAAPYQAVSSNEIRKVNNGGIVIILYPFVHSFEVNNGKYMHYFLHSNIY